MLEFAGPPRESAGAQVARHRAERGGKERKTRRSPTTTMGRQVPHDSTPSHRSPGGTPGPEVATLVQGRFKRDGSAAAEQEPRGGTDRGSSPQHAQNRGPAVEGAGPDTSATVKAKGRGKSVKARVKAKAGSPAPAGPAEQDEAIPKAPNGPGSRLAMQNWRISTRLVSLLTLPVVAATTLGGFRINDSLNDIAQLEHMQLLTTMTRQATNLAAMLQEERDLSAGPLSLSRGKTTSSVDVVRQQTDTAAKAFAAATDKVDSTGAKDDTLRSIRNNVLQIGRQLTNIETIRTRAYVNGAQQTVSEYNAVIVSLLSLSQDMAQATSNPEMIKRTRALAAFSAAKEYASIQRAIIAASLPDTNERQGELKENDRLYALSAQKGEQQAKTTFGLVYQGRTEELLAGLGDSNSEISTADGYSRRVLASQDAFLREKNRSWLDWYDADGTKLQAMKVIELTLLEEMEQKARELKNEAQQDAIINGALILLVLGVSLVGAFVMARSMIRSLRRLQDTATRVAQDRLPELVKQLSESDPQDVDTSVESVGVHTRDEIGQVAAAFDDVHREAVRLAAEQALLRGNVNAMFTNLSRRSQGLIQRQLSLISELESREADPDQLSSLFKLDHLATRMRRNGENLLVLAGEEPGRRWTRPVPLVDVLRAAASEVEQYERVELASVPGTDVAGRVVNDLVHVLAELLENATSFSSPQTKVKVTGHALPDGRVLVEIHDTGIGLSPRTSPRSTSDSRRRRPWTSPSPGAWACSWSAACPCDTASGSSCAPPTRVVRRPSSCCRWTSPRAARSRLRCRARVVRAAPVALRVLPERRVPWAVRPHVRPWARARSAVRSPVAASAPLCRAATAPASVRRARRAVARSRVVPVAVRSRVRPPRVRARVPSVPVRRCRPAVRSPVPASAVARRPVRLPVRPDTRRATASSDPSSLSPSSRSPSSRPRPRHRLRTDPGRSCRRAVALLVRSSPARRPPAGAATRRAVTTSCRAPARRPSSPARTSTPRCPRRTAATARPDSSSVRTCGAP